VCIRLRLFNQVGLDCWISAHPIECTESWKIRNSIGNDVAMMKCTCRDNGFLYQWAFYYTLLWAVFIVVMLLMRAVYMSVRKQEIIMER
jgi:hypothetical protein